MPKLDFRPNNDGFRFPNAFTNYIVDGPVQWTTIGRCGGMAAAAIDYYRNRIPIPTHVATDMPHQVPAEGTRLSTYIYNRLLSTILRPEGAKFVLGPWVTDADCYRWSMTDEFPKFCRRADAGQLSIVGLWSQTGGVGRGHQIVCYGYETDPPTLWVYATTIRTSNAVWSECRRTGASRSALITEAEATPTAGTFSTT